MVQYGALPLESGRRTFYHPASSTFHGRRRTRMVGEPCSGEIGQHRSFSQGFSRDFALVWAEDGLEAVRKVPKKNSETSSAPKS